MLWRFLLFTLFLLVPCLHAQDQSQFWPELDTYVELTPRTERLRHVVGKAWLVDHNE